MKRIDGKFALAVVPAVALFLISFLAVSLTGQFAPAGELVVPLNPLKLAGPTQPIPYSHKAHMSLPGMQCQTCHTAPEPGALMTFPAASVCMQCHSKVASNRPTIRKLAQLAKGKEPIPWVRVYVIRPNHAGDAHEAYEKSSGVVWSHKSHTAAGVTCAACHGAVAEMDVMSELTTTTTKGGCMTCHNQRSTVAQKSKQTACATCHKDYTTTLQPDWRSLTPP